MNWNCYVEEFTLSPIESGEKDIEVRAAIAKFEQVRVGDTLTFNEICAKRVTAIRTYKTLEEMITVEDPRRILPGATADEIVNGLHELLGQTVRLGIIIFELSTS